MGKCNSKSRATRGWINYVIKRIFLIAILFQWWELCICLHSSSCLSPRGLQQFANQQPVHRPHFKWNKLKKMFYEIFLFCEVKSFWIKVKQIHSICFSIWKKESYILSSLQIVMKFDVLNPIHLQVINLSWSGIALNSLNKLISSKRSFLKIKRTILPSNNMVLEWNTNFKICYSYLHLRQCLES